MPRLKELLLSGQAGLTVYLPDSAQSHLWGNLDHAIHAATGFRVVKRKWVNQDINSVARFYQGPNEPPPAEQDPEEALRKYENIPPEALQYGSLMVKMLINGPSLVTIWEGEEAIPTLLRVKGKTQPAEAPAGSIRGSFWCDNGVCNLLHSSDDAEELVRELTALNLDHWLDEMVTQSPLIAPIANPHAHVAHSGIVAVCAVVARVLLDENVILPPVTLPPSGDAKETNTALTSYLTQIAQRHAVVAPFIDAFLKGALIQVTSQLKSLPATRWEQFIIQCGAVNRETWIKE